MMRDMILSVMALGAMPVSAGAEGCFGAGTPLFHCTLEAGAKRVDACLQGDVATYRFRPAAGVPDLLLAQPVGEVEMWPWPGVGRWLSEAAGFANDGFAYRVSHAVDRLSENPEVTGAVQVLRGDAVLAELPCDPGSVTVADLYPLYEAKEAAGQCWSREAQDWTRC
jgi:hypothetical protein